MDLVPTIALSMALLLLLDRSVTTHSGIIINMKGKAEVEEGITNPSGISPKIDPRRHTRYQTARHGCLYRRSLVDDLYSILTNPKAIGSFLQRS